ncbi:hypothetical protein LCGC14_2004200 [marine sediment metagenome]|uniref:Uncharacterized protein n=1 Tax=marine sediment metagenome TaxID=412755 RepID=A0A0F9FQ04_9ZZZZ
MKYIELPPKEMVAFADKLKEECGLIIKMCPTKVTLDESQHGKGWVAWKKSYLFKVIKKDDDGVLECNVVTMQNGDGTALVAVTKRQHKNWKNWKVVSEPFGWGWGRFESCVAQITHC